MECKEVTASTHNRYFTDTITYESVHVLTFRTPRGRSDRTCFLLLDASLLNCFRLAESVFHAAYAHVFPPAALHVFGGELQAPEVEKYLVGAEKRLTSCAFSPMSIPLW